MEPNKQSGAGMSEGDARAALETTPVAATPAETNVTEPKPVATDAATTAVESSHTSEPIVAPEAAAAAGAGVATTAATTTKSHTTRNTVIAILIVAMMLLGVWYVLEKQGRVNSNFFGAIAEMMRGPVVVASVNGTDIMETQLEISITQLEQAATLQGMDVTSPTVQSSLRVQALDVLINTELLLQGAAERGITVTDEEITTRIAEIETEVGGAEILQARMDELGIDEAKLQSDVEQELIIGKMLDQLMAETAVTVTDEEVQQAYDNAVASGADVPALDEVREVIVEQLSAAKEQEVIDEFLTEQKATAEIERTDAV